MNAYLAAAIAAGGAFGAATGSVLAITLATQWARRQQEKAAREAMHEAKERTAAMLGLSYDRETGEMDCGHEGCREKNEERRKFAEEMRDAMQEEAHPLYERLRLEFAFKVQAGEELPDAAFIGSRYGVSPESAAELIARLHEEFGLGEGE